MHTTYKTVRLSDLKPYGNNPRFIDGAIPDVVESMRQVGYITPIVVDEDGVILAGHTRYAALRQLGGENAKVEVIVAEGLTEEQKKKFRLYDNKTGEIAEWDQAKLHDELFDVDFNGYDFGQPVKETKAAPGAVQTKTCPCCGEVFEV